LYATLVIRMILNRKLSILVNKIYEPLDVERKKALPKDEQLALSIQDPELGPMAIGLRTRPG
jgi:hypothetical protein